MKHSKMFHAVPKGTMSHKPETKSAKPAHDVGSGSRPGKKSVHAIESSAPADAYHLRGPVPGALK